ncbi:hypothetical protein C8Q75DRAFT_731587 [Abortiporus biennis]|nr:hypothetical protein C8Q75DRAFT_731587 [Abortiporus biennis]
MNRPLTTANHRKSLVFIGGAIALTAAAIYIVQSSETNPQEAAETADIASLMSLGLIGCQVARGNKSATILKPRALVYDSAPPAQYHRPAPAPLGSMRCYWRV